MELITLVPSLPFFYVVIAVDRGVQRATILVTSSKRNLGGVKNARWDGVFRPTTPMLLLSNPRPKSPRALFTHAV